MPTIRYDKESAINSLASFNSCGMLENSNFGIRMRGLSVRPAHDLLHSQDQFGPFGLWRGSPAEVVDDLDQLISPPLCFDRRRRAHPTRVKCVAIDRDPQDRSRDNQRLLPALAPA